MSKSKSRNESHPFMISLVIPLDIGSPRNPSDKFMICSKKIKSYMMWWLIVHPYLFGPNSSIKINDPSAKSGIGLKIFLSSNIKKTMGIIGFHSWLPSLMNDWIYFHLQKYGKPNFIWFGKSYIEPKQVFLFRGTLDFQGLLIDHKIMHLGFENPTYPFIREE